MRNLATTTTADDHREIRIRSGRARDPEELQVFRASINPTDRDTPRLGGFYMFDPDTGIWEPNAQQVGILRDIVCRIEESWIEDILHPIANGNGGKYKLSLRLLDWFVTNYAKSQHVVINDVPIYQLYTDTRSIYTCRYFDPFRRRLKLKYMISDQTFYSTIGQVNFVFWAYEHGIIEYVKRHKYEIEADMEERCTPRSGECTGKRTRTTLSESAIPLCRITRHKV